MASFKKKLKSIFNKYLYGSLINTSSSQSHMAEVSSLHYTVQ